MQLGCYKVFRIFHLVTLGYCPLYKNIERISRSTSTTSQILHSPVGEVSPVKKVQFEFKLSLLPNPSTLMALRLERRRITFRSRMSRMLRRQHNVSRRIPDKVLGRTYNTWTVVLLRTFLQRYGRAQPHGTSKTHLMQVMNQVARDYNLEDSDYDDMYSAYWGRQGLPARKPLAATLRPAAVASPTEQPRAASPPRHPISPIPTPDLTTLPSRTGQPEAICTVCWDELSADTTPEEAITSHCAHEPNVCRSCVSQSIDSQLDSKMWDQISCPACDAEMKFGDVIRLASATVFTRYSHPSFACH